MNIVIQSSALADLADGYEFYERNEQSVGGYFLDSLYSDIDSLQRYGGIHMTQFGMYHRLLSKKFPYGIYYRAEKNTVLVCAVLDFRRDSKWIKRHLR